MTGHHADSLENTAVVQFGWYTQEDDEPGRGQNDTIFPGLSEARSLPDNMGENSRSSSINPLASTFSFEHGHTNLEDSTDWLMAGLDWAGPSTDRADSLQSKESSLCLSNHGSESDLIQNEPYPWSYHPESTRNNGEARSRHRNQGQKRTMTSAFGGEELSMLSPRKRTAPGTNTTQGDTKRDQLACPFQKLNPQKHQDCLKYSLHRIKDVKQHVYRRHMQPGYYCARCSETFETTTGRDEHTRRADCEKLPVHRFDGISADQKFQLNKNHSRGMDHRDQWFEMWDIIFPDQERPPSAYVGSYTEEMLPLLRDLWENRQDEIIDCALKDQDTGCLNRTQLSRIVTSLLDCLETETAKYPTGFTPCTNTEVPATHLVADPLPIQSVESQHQNLTGFLM